MFAYLLSGPFWICTTLVFTTAIAGNLANYFQTVGTNQWVYDFHKGQFVRQIIIEKSILRRTWDAGGIIINARFV